MPGLANGARRPMRTWRGRMVDDQPELPVFLREGFDAAQRCGREIRSRMGLCQCDRPRRVTATAACFWKSMRAALKLGPPWHTSGPGCWLTSSAQARLSI